MVSSKIVRYVLPASGLLMGGAFGVAAYTAHLINGPRKRTFLDDFSFSPLEVQVPHESIEFQTEDGLTLRGWWLPRDESDRVVVGCTGHRGAKHELLGIGAALWRADNNVLLFDFRGCCDSDMSAGSLAHLEVRDGRAAVEFALQRKPNAGVGMIGYSMGAAVAIFVAASTPSVAAIVSDSSFASASDVIAHAYRRRGLPVQPFLGFTNVVNRWRYGYALSAVRPVDVVSQIAPRPLLLIHGSADPIVPVEQARQLYDAARGHKELWIVEDGRHCGAYFADREAYISRVTNFFAEAMH
jgi:fermentation-respiration switch protein FrsA (DUF1100 family)